jgi:hypothetical protein
LQLGNRWGSIVVSCCEKLVAEVGNSSGFQREGNVRRWKPLPSNVSEDATVDTSVRVTVTLKVQSCAVSKTPTDPIINPNPVYSHGKSGDNI